MPHYGANVTHEAPIWGREDRNALLWCIIHVSIKYTIPGS